MYAVYTRCVTAYPPDEPQRYMLGGTYNTYSARWGASRTSVSLIVLLESPPPAGSLLYDSRVSPFVSAMALSRRQQRRKKHEAKTSQARLAIALIARGERSIDPLAGEVGDPGLRATLTTTDSVLRRLLCSGERRLCPWRW